MNITYLLPIIIAVVYLMIFMSSNKILTAYIVKRNIKRKRGLNQNMNELLQSFIEKDCIIYCVNNTSVDGIIKDVYLSKRATDFSSSILISLPALENTLKVKTVKEKAF